MSKWPPVAAERALTAVRPSNLFDLIRILAASLVILGHGWSLNGTAGVPRLAGISIHHLGVFIFFIVSGFLITRSWERNPRPVAFLVRRSLRIFPALILVVVLSVFALGPILTADAAAYWRSSGTWAYLSNVTLVATYDLPGVFEANPKTAFNGSLWSLGPEFCCYVTVLVLGSVGVAAARLIRGLLALSLALGVLLVPMPDALKTTIIAAVCFLIGSLYTAVQLRRMPITPAVVGGILLCFLDGAVGVVAMWVVLPYLVLTVGVRRSGVARTVHRWGDPSYGMYLWGFPVQQILVAAGIDSIAMHAVLALTLAGALGYASWHVLEKHAIALGARLSGRSSPVAPLA